MEEEIEIYWWNMGKKTLDFTGDYKDFFKEKDIKIRKLPKDKFGLEKYRFKISWSSCNATFNIASHYKDCCKEAVKIFLIILGDKTLFMDHNNREHRLNWN